MQLAQDFSDQLSNLNQRLGTDFSIVSEIRDQDYKVLSVASELEHIKVGDHFKTCDTYCNEVIKRRELVFYNSVGTIKSMILHPIYTAMQLEAYIGEPLYYEGRIIGTLNFSGFMPKQPAFTNEDISAVKELAREIEAALESA